MRILKFHKVLSLFLFLCLFSSVYVCAGSSEGEDELPHKAVTFRVYRLITSIDEALREKKDGRPIEYSYPVPCQKNPGCRWISKERSVTAPHAWTLIAQGLGRELAGEDESERNKGEHWVYDMPAEASGCGQHFAIVWGMGEFFEVTEHTRCKLKGEGTYEGRSINAKYGDPDFGYEIVRNLVEDPIETKKYGHLEGKPFIPFCSNLKGADFCSITMSLASIGELPALCAKLWRYRNAGSRQLYKTIEDLAKARGHKMEPLGQRSEASQEEVEQEEGEEVEVEGRMAITLFGKRWTFEGIREYIEETKRAVQGLIAQGTVALPDYDEKALKRVPPKKEDDGEEVKKEGSSSQEKEKTKWEELYNIMAAQTNDYVLLDQKEVSNVEICDVWVPKARQLVHVKIGTESAVLNHLFGQGYASAKLLSHEDFSEKVILELVRREVLVQMRTKMQAKFAAVKGDLWKQFTDWRGANKTILVAKYGGAKENKVRTLIAKIESKEKHSADHLAALKELHKSLKGKDQEELEKILKDYEKEGNSTEEDVAAFLAAQLKKTATLLDMDHFPEDKNGFQKFCKDLGAFVEKDTGLKKLVDDLEQYRVDAIEGHIENAWGKNEADMKVPSKFLEDLTRDGLSTIDRWQVILGNILANYDKVKENKRSNKTHFSAKDLQEVLELEALSRLYERLFAGFISRAEDPAPYQVVYAIITPKDPTDGNVLPLGARINLLRVAEDLRAIEGRKKFTPVVQIVPDVTEGRKVLPKKAAVAPSAPTKKVRVGISRKPAVKGATKKGSLSSSSILLASPPEEPSFAYPTIAVPGTIPTPYIKAIVDYGTEVRPDGLHDNYVLCPTKGDGDCFFHALLTEPGDDLGAITKKAADIRDSLREVVQAKPAYLDILRRELLSKYKMHFHKKEFAKIPASIRSKLEGNEAYVILRQSILDLPLNADDPLLFIQANPHPPITDEVMLNEILNSSILKYLEDYKSANVGLEKAYIEIPTGRDWVASLGDIICREQDICAHCFMYDRSTGKLNFKGSLGDLASSKVRHLLMVPGHYWALYRDDFAAPERVRLQQIKDNEAMATAVAGAKRLRAFADAGTGSLGKAAGVVAGEIPPGPVKQPRLDASSTDEESEGD